MSMCYANDVNTALRGASEFLKQDNFNHKPCYTVSSLTGSVQNEHDWKYDAFTYSMDAVDNKQTPKDICIDPCCYRIIIFLNNFGEVDSNWLQHRLYVLINFNDTENAEELITTQDNLVLFQKKNRLFGVYDKFRGKMRKIAVWDGKAFSQSVIRDFHGEKLRVGSGILPLFTNVYTNPDNGKVIFGDGLENIFFKVLSKVEDLELHYIDALPYDPTYWGRALTNGSFTGLLYLLLEVSYVDVTSMQHMCGFIIHPNLQCSHAYDYDGLALAAKRPPPLASWTGIITPYNSDAWLGIACLLIVATLVLGTCHKLSINNAKMDWSLHFLDALNPMTGRNMTVPGFDAAHLGKEKKILGFEIFLIIYSLACVVINTGYEGNLKSHLMAKKFPKPIQDWRELYDQAHLYKGFYDVRSDGNVVEFLVRQSENPDIKRLQEVIEMWPKPEDVSWDDYHLYALDDYLIHNAGANLKYQIQRAMTKKDGTTDIQIIPKWLILNPYTLHLARMNRFNEILDHRLLEWFDAGMFQLHFKWGLENIESKPLPEELDNSDEPVWAPLPIDLFRLLYGVYGAGVIIGFSVFLYELFRSRKNKM